MQMNDDLRAMARHRYGYGCWDAPYWFLGLEEGMDPGESDARSERTAAWRSLGSVELDDCQEFHDRIFALIKKRNGLHGDNAVLQRTWRRLLLAFMAFSGGTHGRDKSARLSTAGVGLSCWRNLPHRAFGAGGT